MLNEKMLYQKAEAEVICFDNTDVITASGGDECLWTPGVGGGGGGGGHWVNECPCSFPQTGTGYTVWVPD